MAMIETTLEREDSFTIEVEYSYSKGGRGSRDSLCGVRGAGPPLEPDEPPDVEIVRVVKAETGEEIELYPDELTRVRELCFEDVADRAEARAEARLEAMRERGKRLY